MAPPAGPDAATRARIKDIKLEDVDFEKVQSCNDKHELKRYIQLLQDDGSYYVDLLKACKEKLLKVAPKEYYSLYPLTASQKEVEDATLDLLDWEASVKETDRALLSAKKSKIFDQLPGGPVPVRGQEPVAPRANLQQAPPTRPPAKRGEAFARDKSNMKDYYSAWDKVDVDALEDEMDKEEQAQEESRRRHFEDLRSQQEDAQAVSEVTQRVATQDVPRAHWKHMADSEKEKGNEAFYAKDWEEAEAYYSRSIQFCPEDPSTWTNRALVRLKMERPGDALEDCEHALALCPRYMKALHRKGKALHELKRYEEAVRHFQMALAESPGNTQINGDLMVSRRHLRSQPADAPQPSRALPADPRPKADPSPKQNGPPAGYTRVVIEEDSSSDEERPSSQEKRAPSRQLNPRTSSVIIEEVSDSDEEVNRQQAGPPAAASGTSISTGLEPGSAKPNAEEGRNVEASFCKVAIQEVSDSDGEDPVTAASQCAAAAEHVPVRAPPAAQPGFRRVAIQEVSSSESEGAASCDDEEQSAAAVDPAPAVPGFRRVQIQEVSDSEDEEPAACADPSQAAESSAVPAVPAPAHPAAPAPAAQGLGRAAPERPAVAAPTQHCSAAPAPGFHKVHIQEVSDSEGEEQTAVAAPTVAAQAASQRAAPEPAVAVMQPSPGPSPGFRRVHIQQVTDSEEEEPAPAAALAPNAATSAVPASGSKSEAAPPASSPAGPAGFRRVAIEAASDSEEEPPSQATAAPGALPASQASFHRVAVREASESEEEPGTNQLPGSPRWRRLEIEEASDSSGEEGLLRPASRPKTEAKLPSVPVAPPPDVCLEEMD